MAQSHFLPYAKQNINTEDIESVKRSLEQSVITRGELVEAFEKEFAKYCNASYAVSFNSGTAALMAAYAAAETGPHDTLVTTPNTFVSTVGAGVQQGATPVFVDIDTKTGNIDIERLALNINRRNSKGKTIIAPIHFAGIPVDMEALEREITDHKTIVIEDAAQAMGSCYKDGSRVGSCRWSHMTTFSFHPAKIMTTGEGGMVTTNDQELYRRLKIYRNNGTERDPQYWRNPGIPGYYEAVELTGNYNVTEMQAALGLSQMKRLEGFIAKRRELVDSYSKKLAGLGHVRLLEPSAELSIAWHLFVVQVDFARHKKDKSAVMEALHKHGIGTQVHYIPVYRHPYFVDRIGDISEYFPENEQYYHQALTLPLYCDLTEEDVDRVVSELKKALSP